MPPPRTRHFLLRTASFLAGVLLLQQLGSGSRDAVRCVERRRVLEALGRLEWGVLGRPHDLDAWMPDLRALLEQDVPASRSSAPALAVRSSAAVGGSAAACSGTAGRWDQLAGACQCPLGRDGDVCQRVSPQQCNDDRATCNGTKRNVQDLIAGVDRPNCYERTLMSSRCAGECDLSQNRCVCGPRSRYPERHMKGCEFEGLEQLTPWERGGSLAKGIKQGWDGFSRVRPWELWGAPNATPPWFERKVGGAALAALWRAATPDEAERQRKAAGLAWCDRPPDKKAQRDARALGLVNCRCYENREGAGCAQPVASWCPNQCNGRGECLSGFCRCRHGWSGVDCSVPLVPAVPASSSTSASASASTSTSASSSASASTSASASASASASTSATAQRAEAHAQPRLRPSIYVYELPSRFNVRLMEGRTHSGDCVFRRYEGGAANATTWLPAAFGLEVAVHELLLASRHRTLDPETADFFFVPVYGGCYISRYFRPTPDHNLFTDEAAPWLPAPVLGTRFYRAAIAWVRGSFPFWARRGGADHLLAFPHDEGACVAPLEARRAIKLTSWGREERAPPNSSTVMPEHSWHHGPFVKEMYASLRCFDPDVDVLMPVFTAVTSLAQARALQPPQQQPAATPAAAAPATATTLPASPLARPLSNASLPAGAPPPPLPAAEGRRGWLVHFRGQVHATSSSSPRGYRNYSFGIRQQAFALLGGREKEGLLVAEGHSARYVEEVRNATYCLVMPGNGWGHVEVPVMLGCIPVVVGDGIRVPWEGTLDLAAFGLRVPRAQLASLPQILRAIPEARVRRLQRGLARVWERFTYSSLALAERSRRCGSPGWTARDDGCLPTPALGASRGFLGDARLTGRDAVETLMHVLRAKLVKREQAERAEHQRRQGGEATVRDAC